MTILLPQGCEMTPTDEMPDRRKEKTLTVWDRQDERKATQKDSLNMFDKFHLLTQDFCKSNGITGLHDLPKASGWGVFIDELSEQYDHYGIFRGWALTIYHPEASQPRLALIFIFDDGLVTVDLLNRVIVGDTIIYA